MNRLKMWFWWRNISWKKVIGWTGLTSMGLAVIYAAPILERGLWMGLVEGTVFLGVFGLVAGLVMLFVWMLED